MSPFRQSVAGLLGLLALAVPGAAQEPLMLRIVDGQVTLRAANVPVSAILSEWARVGGTNVVGAERLPVAPVTIELDDVSERQALDVLLRGASGYLLARRPAGTSGASFFNRILIMPASTAPRALPAPTPTAAPRLPQPAPVQAEPEGPEEGPGRQNGPGGPVQMPTVSPPAPLPVPAPDAPVSPQVPGVVVTPSNPFGVPTGSSENPGGVTPVPQQQPAGNRPPDGN